MNYSQGCGINEIDLDRGWTGVVESSQSADRSSEPPHCLDSSNRWCGRAEESCVGGEWFRGRRLIARWLWSRFCGSSIGATAFKLPTRLYSPPEYPITQRRNAEGWGSIGAYYDWNVIILVALANKMIDSGSSENYSTGEEPGKWMKDRIIGHAETNDEWPILQTTCLLMSMTIWGFNLL